MISLSFYFCIVRFMMMLSFSARRSDFYDSSCPCRSAHSSCVTSMASGVLKGSLSVFLTSAAICDIGLDEWKLFRFELSMIILESRTPFLTPCISFSNSSGSNWTYFAFSFLPESSLGLVPASSFSFSSCLMRSFSLNSDSTFSRSSWSFILLFRSLSFSTKKRR